MAIQKKDFIEIFFTGKTQDGEVFDSNIKEDLEKLESKLEPKPLIICIGEKMFLPAIEDFLIGKEIGKEYSIELQPEKAFGKRNPSLVKMIPLKIFHEQQLSPRPGMMLNMDGMIAKVISVSGGRTLVDFNNPLAGKVVDYKVKVIKKVEDINDKTRALIDFFTKQDLKFEIIEQKRLIITAPEGFDKLLILLKDKFKELLELDLEVKIDKNVKQPTEIQEHTHAHKHE